MISILNTACLFLKEKSFIAYLIVDFVNLICPKIHSILMFKYTQLLDEQCCHVYKHKINLCVVSRSPLIWHKSDTSVFLFGLISTFCFVSEEVFLGFVESLRVIAKLILRRSIIINVGIHLSARPSTEERKNDSPSC
uniref:Putative Per a allergen n=1 Tax=Periplaneta americana TaxID=6978 RepID=A0A2P0XJ05_PERAM|nr:putative Per a allergen [Periplaneta americana]